MQLLGALAFSLAEQQAEQGRTHDGGHSSEQAALVEARAALKSQQLEAERAVAAATQQAVQLEAERAAAIAAAAEAMRQRKEAENQLAAQQQQLQQLQHQRQYPQQGGHGGGLSGMPQGFNPSGGNANGQGSGYGSSQPPLPPAPYGDGQGGLGGFGQGNPGAYQSGHGGSFANGGPACGHHHHNGASCGGGYNNNSNNQSTPAAGAGMHGCGASAGGAAPMHSPQPIVCEFCGRWLSEMALDQGNHMCDEFWSYNAEFQACGAQCALLIGGVQHLKPEHLQSFAMRFPNMRRVKHGASASEFNGLFMLTDEQRQTQALRLLANCNVRTIPLGHAASWRCLHVQLAPSSCPQRVGQAEQSLQNQLLRVMQQRQGPGVGGVDAEGPGAAAGRGQAAADAWTMRANEAKRRNTEPMLPGMGNFYGGGMGGGNGPGSTTGDWKCANCGNINFAFREKCNRCNTPRPGAKLFGPITQNERRICPFTVMLMRVPSHATEIQVAEALLTFGELAPGGIKFHRQGAKFKQRRVRMPPDGLALHAFCRFLRPNSAAAALQRGEVLILGQPVQINPAFMRGAMPADIEGNGTGFGVPPGGLPQIGTALGQLSAMGQGGMGQGGMGQGGMGQGGMSQGGMGQMMGQSGMGQGGMSQGGMGQGGMGQGNLGGRGGMPPLPGGVPYPGQLNMAPPLPGAMGQSTMPPLPPSGGNGQMLGADGQVMGGWDGGGFGGMGGGGLGSDVSNLEMQMSSLTTGPAAAPESAAAIDVASFLSAALPLLWQMDSFKAQVMHISPASDGLVIGVQSALSALTDSPAALASPSVLHSTVPILFGDGGRSKLAAATDATDAYEAMLSMFTESADQRFVACVERHTSMSIMEMCECTCDEMLEPLHYKQPVAAISVPVVLGSLADGGGASAIISQLAACPGPLCPTANCGNRMKILRYLMPPMPAAFSIGLTWDSAPPQSNTIHSLLSSVPTTIDLQQAFKSVPQPATASLRGLLCAQGAAFHSFGYDPAVGWLHWGDGSSAAVGDDWEVVISQCSQLRYKPAVLIYQVHPSQF